MNSCKYCVKGKDGCVCARDWETEELQECLRTCDHYEQKTDPPTYQELEDAFILLFDGSVHCLSEEGTDQIDAVYERLFGAINLEGDEDA
jgi:hypothetical protein